MTNILCLITLGDSEQEVDRLLQALWQLSATFSKQEKSLSRSFEAIVPPPSRFSLPPREAFYSHSDRVGLHQCIGRVVTEFVYVYPPGIPILIPGQIVTTEVVDYIRQHVEAGLPVKGPEDPKVRELRVISEPFQNRKTSGSRCKFIIPD